MHKVGINIVHVMFVHNPNSPPPRISYYIFATVTRWDITKDSMDLNYTGILTWVYTTEGRHHIKILQYLLSIFQL